jgi:Na+-transporting NADH:ubiquinone oxidoreductase subunit NqrC
MSKSRGLLAIAISAALFSGHTYVASADATPSPSPANPMDAFKAAQEQYKKDRDIYLTAIRDREMKLRTINTTFKNSVDKATSDAKTAMLSATTPEQKNSINSLRRTAIANAIVARESAIAALESMPTPPVEPVRPTKAVQQEMSNQKGKQKR